MGETCVRGNRVACPNHTGTRRLAAALRTSEGECASARQERRGGQREAGRSAPLSAVQSRRAHRQVSPNFCTELLRYNCIYRYGRGGCKSPRLPWAIPPRSRPRPHWPPAPRFPLWSLPYPHARAVLLVTSHAPAPCCGPSCAPPLPLLFILRSAAGSRPFRKRRPPSRRSCQRAMLSRRHPGNRPGSHCQARHGTQTAPPARPLTCARAAHSTRRLTVTQLRKRRTSTSRAHLAAQAQCSCSLLSWRQDLRDSLPVSDARRRSHSRVLSCLQGRGRVLWGYLGAGVAAGF